MQRATLMFNLLSQVKLEDVFRSTQQNMQAEPGADRLLMMGLVILLGAAGLMLIAHIRRRQAMPRRMNSPRRLLSELRRGVPLSRQHIRGLKAAAARMQCSSPAALLLCPSVLAEAASELPPQQQEAIAELLRRLEAASEENSAAGPPADHAAGA